MENSLIRQGGGGEDKLRQLNQAYYSGDGSLIENFFSINRKLAFY